MYQQFDLLVAVYVDGALVSNNTRQNHNVPRNFQISQVYNKKIEVRQRLDILYRKWFENLQVYKGKVTHESTKFYAADSNNSDDFYTNNPQAEGLILLNLYAKAQHVHKFCQVNIGPRERPLIVLQLFFLTNASYKLKKYDMLSILKH